jgi:hydrogenase maturation factor HypF (carbamoyltransferase family)
MDDMEREQQQQVEQNIAVRCVRDVGTMMATMHVPNAIATDLLEKLQMLDMISGTGKDVAAALCEEQYQAAERKRESELGRERAWLEGRLQRALEAEQQAMDRVSSYKAQCAAMDEQCAEMEARERATRAEIEKQDEKWEEVVTGMREAFQEKVERLQQEAQERAAPVAAPAAAAAAAAPAETSGGPVAEYASPDIM